MSIAMLTVMICCCYTGNPVIYVGNMATGRQAEQIPAEDLADMVAVGRGNLCDPAWENKAIAVEELNPCSHCRHCLWY